VGPIYAIERSRFTVSKSYPELVAYGDDGKVETVRYSMLTPMLLNELQKQTAESARLAAQRERLSAEMAQANASYELKLSQMQKRLAALEQAMHTESRNPKLADAYPALATDHISR